MKYRIECLYKNRYKFLCCKTIFHVLITQNYIILFKKYFIKIKGIKKMESKNPETLKTNLHEWNIFSNAF